MFSKRDWETCPRTYRAREIRVLAGWIRAGESGSVVGLPGAGKSNLLDFVCYRPELIAERYLQDSSFKLALVLIDLNDLPENDLSTLYRVILRSLYEVRAQLTSIEESFPCTVQHLYRKVEEKTDPFVSQSALREILFSFKQRQARLVLVLDSFDAFCRTAETQVLDKLRSLRDSFKATLSYIVGLRHELAYLRDPVDLGELYEILDTHVCWLGPMQREDARWVINQIEKGIGQPFAVEQVEWLIDLSGGYPALLRAASLWLAQVSPVPHKAAWEDALLAERSVQNRLREMWRGLTGEEQAALAVLQAALSGTSRSERQKSLAQIEEKYQDALARLQVKHLCAKIDVGWKVFSPLFAQFVASTGGVITGKIRYDPETDRFFRGERELADLSNRDRRLLRHFLAHPPLTHSIDDLIDAAWAEDDSRGVSNAAVQQAIRHLRKRIEINPAKPCYLVTQHGAGYRFFPEGAPEG